MTMTMERVVNGAKGFLAYQRGVDKDTITVSELEDGTPCIFFIDPDDDCLVLSIVRWSEEGIPSEKIPRDLMEKKMALYLVANDFDAPAEVRFDAIDFHILDTAEGKGRAMLRHHINIGGDAA